MLGILVQLKKIIQATRIRKCLHSICDCLLVFAALIIVSSITLNSSQLFAGTAPTFLIVALSPTTVSVPVNGIVTVRYRVTNQTSITRTLTTKVIQGVSQSTQGSGTCPRPFTLAPSQSCELVLKIQGDKIPLRLHGGPEVCKTRSAFDNRSDPFLCAQPYREHILNVTRVKAEQPIISIDPKKLHLIMTGPTKTITVRNRSTTVTATQVRALNPLPAGVTQDASNCLRLAPLSTCRLKFTPGKVTAPPTKVTIKGTNTNSVTALISVGKASLLVTGSPLDLVISHGPGSLIISNISDAVVRNVSATLPPTWTDVTQDASDCVRITPNSSCALTFTPGLTDYPGETIPIFGTNTKVVTAKISVTEPGKTNLHISPRSITLSIGGSANITVTNTSATIDAINVRANLWALSGYVTVTNNCPDPLPHQSTTNTNQNTCTMKITAGNQVIGPKNITIDADNLSVDPIPVSVAIVKVPIQVSGSPLDLVIGKGPGTLTVSNLSSSTAAKNVSATLPSSWTDVNQDASDCVNIAPNSNCTLKFYPGTTAYPGATVPISGSNTQVLNAQISVTEPGDANLAVTPTALNLVAGCPVPSIITINNTSQSNPAVNVRVNLGALTGFVTASDNCPNLLDKQSSCTVTITARNQTISPTELNIEADNLSVPPNPVNVTIRNTTLYSGAFTVPEFFVYSTDNGNSWSQTSPPGISGGGSSLYVKSNGTIYAGTPNGFVMISPDNGNTWMPTPTPPTTNGSPVNGIYIGPDGTIYAATNNPNLYYSNDNGNTWQQTLPPDSTSLLSVFVTSDDTIYVGTFGGNVVYSTNQGTTWIPTTPSPFNSLPVNSVFVTSSAIFATGGGPNQTRVAFLEDNKGNTWNYTAPVPSNESLQGLFVTLSGEIYVNVISPTGEINILPSTASSNWGTTPAQPVPPPFNPIFITNQCPSK